MHAIPLARAGMRVLAVDSSTELLTELDRLPAACRRNRGGRSAVVSHASEGEGSPQCSAWAIRSRIFPNTPTSISWCRKSTKRSPPAATSCSRSATTASRSIGDARFIPVRSDERRILTCFLEYEEDTVVVHDILHERAGDAWETRVSSYRKLRLSPERVVASLETIGFETRKQPGLRGMVRDHR